MDNESCEYDAGMTPSSPHCFKLPSIPKQCIIVTTHIGYIILMITFQTFVKSANISINNLRQSSSHAHFLRSYRLFSQRYWSKLVSLCFPRLYAVYSTYLTFSVSQSSVEVWHPPTTIQWLNKVSQNVYSSEIPSSTPEDNTIGYMTSWGTCYLTSLNGKLPLANFSSPLYGHFSPS